MPQRPLITALGRGTSSLEEPMQAVCSTLEVGGAVFEIAVLGDDLRISIKGPSGPPVPLVLGLVSKYLNEAAWNGPGEVVVKDGHLGAYGAAL